MTPDYKEITLAGTTGRLAALQFGDPAGPPLLALHGWLDNAASFFPLAEKLSAFNLVAPDFPGHGRSEHRPSGCVYHLTDYVAEVAAMVAALGWQRFHLLGHSLGAAISMLYSTVCPEKILKLVLIDGIGPLAARPGDAPAQLMKSMAVVTTRKQQPVREFRDWDTLVDARLRAGQMTRANAELLVRRSARESRGKIIVQSDRRLKHPSPLYMSEQQVMAFLKAVNVPVLLILSRSGQVIKRPNTRKRIAAFADIKLIELEGGHHLHMDYPERVATEVSRFIQ